MTLKKLRAKIEDRTAILGVVGLGYVGLPVACKFAEAGFRVIGVDIKPDRVAQINAGENPIEGREPGLAELLEKVVKSGQFLARLRSLEGGFNKHRPQHEAGSARDRRINCGAGNNRWPCEATA